MVLTTDNDVDNLTVEVETKQRLSQVETDQLAQKLAVVNAEIGNLVEAIARGVLVEELTERMRQAEVRRAALREEIRSRSEDWIPTEKVRILPTAVRALMGNLQKLLASGETEEVKAALRPLVTHIDVLPGTMRPGQKKPGCILDFKGPLAVILGLDGQNLTKSGAGTQT